MLEKFTTKDLVVCALFGAALFLLLFILGTALITITGIPASGGILNLLIATLITTIGVKIVNKFGTASIMLTLTGILAVPTLTFGPPGIYKIVILFFTGFIFDVILLTLKKSKISYTLAGLVVGMNAPILIYVCLILFGLPGADKLHPMLVIFSVVYAILGSIGAYLGLWLFDKKLKDKAFIKQMQS